VENRFPEIAALHTRTTLEVLGSLLPGAAEQVRARLQPEVRQALDGATRLDYLPALVDLEVATAIHAVAGADALRRVARETLRRSLTGSLLGALTQSATALFGLTPPGLLRFGARGYARVCRDCGELKVAATSDGLVELALTGLPDGLQVPLYLDAMAGGFEALLDVCEVDGRVRVEARPAGARFLLEWRARRGAARR
jgi:hypothetical protein